MHVVNKKDDDGHSWKKSPKKEWPKCHNIRKYYCEQCGAKAYSVVTGDDKRTGFISLVGEYYDGKILRCPINPLSVVPKEKKKSKLKRIKSSKLTLKRKRKNNGKLTRRKI